jgi:hypothetical protein
MQEGERWFRIVYIMSWKGLLIVQVTTDKSESTVFQGMPENHLKGGQDLLLTNVHLNASTHVISQFNAQQPSGFREEFKTCKHSMHELYAYKPTRMRAIYNIK